MTTAILQPHAERIAQATQDELEQRKAKAEPVMGSVKNAPEVKEALRWKDVASRVASNVLVALGGKNPHSPRELADLLVEWV